MASGKRRLSAVHGHPTLPGGGGGRSRSVGGVLTVLASFKSIRKYTEVDVTNDTRSRAIWRKIDGVSRCISRDIFVERRILCTRARSPLGAGTESFGHRSALLRGSRRELRGRIFRRSSRGQP